MGRFAALTALLQDADHAQGFSSPFEVNFGLFFWTWVVFIVLFFALKNYAWPAILGATIQREKRIADQLAETQRLHTEAQAALDEHKKLLQGARQEAQELIQQARAAGEKEREGLLHRAREEQEQILERAKREIGAERDRAAAELRKDAVELALAAASRLVQQRLSADADRKIVQDYLATLEKSR